jgi:hypothetical protein
MTDEGPDHELTGARLIAAKAAGRVSWEALTLAQRAELEAHWRKQDEDVARGWNGGEAPEQWQPPTEPAKGEHKHKREPKLAPTGFSQGRVNQRKADLWAVRYGQSKLERKATSESYDAFAAQVVAAFTPYDVLDPESVTAAELGAHLKITLALRLEIEEHETQYRHGRGAKWLKAGKVFRLRTVLPCDVTEEQLERRYRKDRNAKVAARRRSERQDRRAKETKQMTTRTQQHIEFTTYAEAMAAMMANVRAQEEALLDAISQEGSTVAELMARVRIHPSWHALAAGKRASFHRIVWRRLDALETAGRLAPATYSGRIRIVRRAPMRNS